MLINSPSLPCSRLRRAVSCPLAHRRSLQSAQNRLYLEQFTCELPESIRQDIHAKIFTANLAEALAREAYDALPTDKSARYFPNVSYILQSLKSRLFSWLIQRVPHDQVLELIALYARTLERKRPNRKAPRAKNCISPKPRRQHR